MWVRLCIYIYIYIFPSLNIQELRHIETLYALIYIYINIHVFIHTYGDELRERKGGGRSGGGGEEEREVG